MPFEKLLNLEVLVVNMLIIMLWLNQNGNGIHALLYVKYFYDNRNWIK